MDFQIHSLPEVDFLSASATSILCSPQHPEPDKGLGVSFKRKVPSSEDDEITEPTAQDG